MTGYQQLQKELVRKIRRSWPNFKDAAAFVKPISDYEHDSRRCLTSVVFIPEDLGRAIEAKIIGPLRNIEPEHYYYPIDTLHLTIKNIRTVDNPVRLKERQVAAVRGVFASAVPLIKKIRFAARGAILFPRSVSVVGYSGAFLKSLIQKLDEGLLAAGMPDNKKYFSNEVFFGNISVCRFVHRPGKAFRQCLRNLEETKFGTLAVKKISLIICDSVNSAKSRKIIEEYKIT